MTSSGRPTPLNNLMHTQNKYFRTKEPRYKVMNTGTVFNFQSRQSLQLLKTMRTEFSTRLSKVKIILYIQSREIKVLIQAAILPFPVFVDYNNDYDHDNDLNTTLENR